jgi:formate dehydrogenase major subunit
MITASIDGKSSTFQGPTTVLNAALEAGIDIPVLCDDPRLKSCGACRVCVVKVKGSPRPLASCTTELKGGMEIETQTAELIEARRMNLRMLARKYPRQPFLQFPEKPFHKLAREYGLYENDNL